MSQKNDKEKILFFRESVFKVAEQLFNYPNTTFHIRLLEEETGFSTTAVTAAVQELKSYKIARVEETPIKTDVCANLEGREYRFYKLVFNLYRLQRWGFVDLLVDVFQNPEAIVVYGSFARGEDIEKSDVDILIVTSLSSSAINDIEQESSFLLRKKAFEKEFNRRLDFKVFNSLDKSAPEFKNSIANGIVLSGYVRVI